MTAGFVQLVRSNAFVGCNRVSKAATWGYNELVAYGAHNSVIILEPTCQKVLCSLPGHTARVNCTRWIRPQAANLLDTGNETLLVSASTDKTIRIWKKSDDPTSLNKLSFTCIAVLENHGDSVTSVDTVTLPDGTVYLAASSADGTVSISRLSHDGKDAALVQKLDFKSKYIETVALSYFVNSAGQPIVVLAAGGIDLLLHIYTLKVGDAEFLPAVTMPGHMDWIRALSFASCGNGKEVVLASASQDNYIRIWRVGMYAEENASTEFVSEQMLNTLEETGSVAFSKRSKVFQVGGERCSVSLDAVVSGHTDLINSIEWAPVIKCEGEAIQPMRLLSSSMDRTMMVWGPDPEDGIWCNLITVGDVGGNTLGFLGACFGPNGKSMLGHDHQGAFSLWVQGDGDDSRWQPRLVVSGHYTGVQDVMWDPHAHYLVSAGIDQTMRVFSSWIKGGSPSPWHEMARVQVHGYDLNCFAIIGDGSLFRIASGADEKVIRVFDGPNTFVTSLEKLSGYEAGAISEEVKSRALGAAVPTLGLSNRPIYEGMNYDEPQGAGPSVGFDEGAVCGADPRVLEEPPLQSHLIQNTLWPETQKLYGHGNELIAICSNHKGTLLASACKAQSANHASIRLWSTKTWKELASLPAHQLTVTQLEFSHDDRYLLSISRDRRFVVHEITCEETGAASLLGSKKAHERIIWACNWEMDDTRFVTASRDKTVKVWDSKSLEQDSALPVMTGAVTAVTFGPRAMARQLAVRCTLAVGLEAGDMSLWAQATDGSWSNMFSFPGSVAHVATVRRLAWQNKGDDVEEKEYALASCSLDSSVRIHWFTAA